MCGCRSSLSLRVEAYGFYEHQSQHRTPFIPHDFALPTAPSNFELVMSDLIRSAEQILSLDQENGRLRSQLKQTLEILSAAATTIQKSTEAMHRYNTDRANFMNDLVRDQEKIQNLEEVIERLREWATYYYARSHAPERKLA